MTRSSEEFTLSSSMVVSSVLLLNCDQNILSIPLEVTQKSALLDALGWLGPVAWTKELS